MKTVYLLKNSPKSFKVLLKLLKMGDIMTNIIIVDRFYSKILRQDKRVKEFPFIINTLPTAKGLIPKIAKVLPFRVYIQIIQMQMKMKMKTNVKTNVKVPNKKRNYNNVRGRTITYKPSLKNTKSTYTSGSTFRSTFTYKKPIIKAIPQKDKSVNIILYNN